jgi:UDP-N-acetylmuramate: L-alanyl-gamma-D-glutamyl-meso-diaminopimelate ligase
VAGHERPYFVIEADEYDTAFFDKRSKFVHYRPRTAVLNNLEFDHADIFDDLAAIERQFNHLLRCVPASGRVVANGFEESLQRVLGAGCWSELRSFGPANADLVAEGPAHDFAVQSRTADKSTAAPRVQWGLSGVFNQHNALAAIAAAEHVGVTLAQSCAALGSFQNVKRRLEVFATVQPQGDAAIPGSAPIIIYDDFAHHPTAIRLTLEGLRAKVGKNTRILAIFEPRSNTMKLGTMKAQLPWSLEAANLAFCHSGGLDWDAAEALAELGDKAQTHNNIAALVQAVAAQARAGDVLVCMSNGGFGGIHAKLQAALSGALSVTLSGA